MKKRLCSFLSVLLVVFLAFALTACGKTIGTQNGQAVQVLSGNQEATTDGTAGQTQEQTKEAAKDKDQEDTKPQEQTTTAPSQAQTQNTQGVSGGGYSSGGAGYSQQPSQNTQPSGGQSSGGQSSGSTPAQQPTEAATQKPTEAATEKPTEPATQKPTEAPTQAVTEPPTQAPTEPATEAPTEPPTEAPTQAPQYVITITVDGCGYGGYGVMSSCTLGFAYQPSVYDALCNCGVGIEGSGYYVSAINGLREKDHGTTSGWMYSVNGTVPMVACGRYYLNSGDNVYWYYVGD